VQLLVSVPDLLQVQLDFQDLAYLLATMQSMFQRFFQMDHLHQHLSLQL
jgi:hypothetical protein